MTTERRAACWVGGWRRTWRLPTAPPVVVQADGWLPWTVGTRYS
jgi:hypothetical protein